MIEIREREQKTLELICEYGGIYADDIKRIYTGAEHYYYKRIKGLINENYLIRKNKILYLGSKGKRYIEENNKSYRNIGTDINLRKRAAEMYKLFSSLENFEIIPSFKLERITSNFAYKYYGKAVNSKGKEYWLYRIGKVVLKENDEESNNRKLRGKELDIQRLKKEIQEIKDYYTNNGLSKDISVIVFVEDKAGMDSYKAVPTQVSLNEEILIPYTKSGLALLDRYVGVGEGENTIVLQKLREQGVNAKLGHSDWNSADFDIEGNFGVNLTTSDYKKELIIKNYLSLSRHTERIVIVCAEAQERKYQHEFKGCHIEVVKS